MPGTYLALICLQALVCSSALRARSALIDDVGVDAGDDGEEPAQRERLLHRVPRGLLFREAVVWREAVKEAGLNGSKVSEWGQTVGKLPASWVRQVDGMNDSKDFRYNFQGTGFASDVKRWRTWVHSFVKENFTQSDYLRFTDPPHGYKLLGEFDRSLAPGGFRPKDEKDLAKKSVMGVDYFKVMKRSNFTLCPRGDRAFSYRFYEAALTRSIPVVSSARVDLSTTAVLGAYTFNQPLRCIGYHYYDLDNVKGPLKYREDWAQDNYELFIKYQTFLKGDNIPPGCPPVAYTWHKPSSGSA